MGILRTTWTRFRGLPLWGQIGIGVLVLALIGAASGGGAETASDNADASPDTTESAPATTRVTQPAKTPEAQLEDDLDDALGSQNRKVKPQVTVKRNDPTTVEIGWAINDNLTEGLIKDGARLEAVKILKAVRNSDVNYDEVWLRGTFALVDKLGNSSEDQVVFGIYSDTTVDGINFENFLFKNVFDITEEPALIHPSFRY